MSWRASHIPILLGMNCAEIMCSLNKPYCDNEQFSPVMYRCFRDTADQPGTTAANCYCREELIVEVWPAVGAIYITSWLEPT